MRTTLFTIGYLSWFGSLFDSGLVAYHLYLFATGEMELTASLYTFFHEHLTWLLWVKDIAYAILPHDFVDWVFALPNLVYFPIRIIISMMAGSYCLKWARGMS